MNPIPTGLYDAAPATAEMDDSAPLLGQPDDLCDRASRDGYLFVRGLLNPAPVLELRRLILTLCGEAGWLDANAPLMEGVAAPGLKVVEPEPAYFEVYDRLMALEAFHALAHAAPLLALLDGLFGEPTLVHPRNIARVIFPANTRFTTPAHQDYIHIRGTPETWTAWIPLGDCPRILGSLAVLPGSHQLGILDTHAADGAGGRGIDTALLPGVWRSVDFRAGDVLLFHSHTVHRALPNEDPQRLRLSVDYRYQPISHPVVADSLLPHFARSDWDSLYTGWRAPELKRYWERLPLTVVER